MDKETKDILNPLIRSLADVAETQGLILELLAQKLTLSDEGKRKLLSQAQARQTNAETWRLSLKDWK